MKKRFVGKSSVSLADGRVVFHGGVADLSAAKWAENAHVIDQFVDIEAASERAASSKKSDKE